MKKDKISEMLNLIDDEYIDEANPETAKIKASEAKKKPKFDFKKNKGSIFKAISICACMIIVVASILVMVPQLSNNNLPDDEGGTVTWAPASPITGTLPDSFASIKDKIDLFVPNIGGNDIVSGNEALANKNNDPNKSPEATDNQTEGIFESDLIKKTSSNIFYVRKNKVYVYNMRGTNTKVVAEYDFSSILNDINSKILEAYNGEEATEKPISPVREMFLSKDQKSLTVIAETTMSPISSVVAISFNVENPEKIHETNVFVTLGRYVSARSVDSQLLLFTDFSTYKNANLYVPQYNDGREFKYVSSESIYAPSTLSDLGYLVSFLIDEKTMTVKDAHASLSFTQAEALNDNKRSLYPIYVSKTGAYISRCFKENGAYKTELLKLSYQNGKIASVGSATLSGYARNQYSFDEYGGVLRVFVTTSFSGTVQDNNSTNVSLYCIDAGTMSELASVISFAPAGEALFSVHFDGAYAFVSTSSNENDPVYYFDISNLDDIKFSDSETDPGISNSLIEFGNGYLLSIGTAEAGTLKFEVFKKEESGLVSCGEYVFKQTYYSRLYKTYLIDKEAGVFGLAINDYNYEGAEITRYIAFRFDGAMLEKLADQMFAGDLDSVRAFYVGTSIYVFSNEASMQISVPDLKN